MVREVFWPVEMAEIVGEDGDGEVVVEKGPEHLLGNFPGLAQVI